MALTIQSTRFGTVQIAEDSVVEFPDGLIGLGASRRYALLVRDPDSPFLWLQSIDDPAIALPVTNPRRFFPSYNVELTDEDAERLGFAEPASGSDADSGSGSGSGAGSASASADIYVTVTASSDLAKFTANLRAPILIRPGRADQVINQAPDAVLKAKLFPSLGADAETVAS